MIWLKLSLAAIFAALILVLFTPSINAASPPESEKCSSVKPMVDFDPTKYNGTWFVRETAAYAVAAPKVRCQKRVITPNEDGTIHLKTSSIVPGTGEDINGESITTDADLFENQKVPSMFVLKDSTETHIVLGTDYDTYTVLLNCLTVNGVRGYILMITSRQEFSKINVGVEKILKDNDLQLERVRMAQGAMDVCPED